MAKPRVIIADEDDNYIVPLQFKFITDFFDKIELEIISDRNYFEEFFSKPQNAEILIVSDELYDSSLQRHSILNVFVMMEQLEEGDTGDLNVNRLFKYTSIKEIFNEIIGKSSVVLNGSNTEKKETQIILVTSAAGGVGKTTVAMGIAASLSMNYKRVLYINASRLQSFQYLLDNNTNLTSPEVYLKLTNKITDDIYKEIKHVIRKELFSYIPAFKASLMSLGIEFSMYKKLAQSVCRSGDYDFIIMDVDNLFGEELIELIDVANRVIVVTKQTKNSVMSTNLFVSNINGITSDKYIFICNDFNKEDYNSLIRPEIDLRFSIENYIDHISDFDNQSIADYAKIQGIQKISLLVM